MTKLLSFYLQDFINSMNEEDAPTKSYLILVSESPFNHAMITLYDDASHILELKMADRKYLKCKINFTTK